MQRPRWGGGAGPRWGWSSSVWRDEVARRAEGVDAPAAAGAHPHPVPFPPWAATPTPVADAAIPGARRLLLSGGVRRIAIRARVAGGVRECRQPRARTAAARVANVGIRASPSASTAWDCPQGDGGTSRSSAVESGGGARRRLVSAPPSHRTHAGACSPRTAGGRSAGWAPGAPAPDRPAPTPLLTGPGSSNPGPPGGPGCPSRRAVRRSGRRAAPACPARRRAPRPGGQWSVPGRSPWRAPDRPFR